MEARIFLILGITLVALGLLFLTVIIVWSVWSTRTYWSIRPELNYSPRGYSARRSPALLTSLFIAFMIGQMFFNTGMMFWLGYLTAQLS